MTFATVAVKSTKLCDTGRLPTCVACSLNLKQESRRVERMVNTKSDDRQHLLYIATSGVGDPVVCMMLREMKDEAFARRNCAAS